MKVLGYYPIAGYEDIVSDVNGIIPKITQELKAGTYYLHETQPLDAYKPIEKDICFTISNTGDVTLADSEDDDRSLSSVEENHIIIILLRS